MVIVCQPAAESASIWAVKISGDTIRLATSPDSPAGGLTRWYSRIGTCSVKAGPEVGTSAGAGVGGGGAEHSESKPGAQAVVVGEDETVGVSAGSGCHCSVVGSGVPAAPGVAAEDARAAYPECAALDGADTPGWRNDEAATRVAPTHRTRAMPKPARIDARRAGRLVRLMMTPSISLAALIVRAPRQSGAGCAASMPRSAPGSAFAVTRRLCSPRHTARSATHRKEKEPNAARRVCWPRDDGRVNGRQPSEGRFFVDRVESYPGPGLGPGEGGCARGGLAVRRSRRLGRGHRLRIGHAGCGGRSLRSGRR